MGFEAEGLIPLYASHTAESLIPLHPSHTAEGLIPIYPAMDHVYVVREKDQMASVHIISRHTGLALGSDNWP